MVTNIDIAQEIAPVVSVHHLKLTAYVDQGTTTPVRDVSFEVAPGESLGIVGESGSGKSLTALTIPVLIDRDTFTVEAQSFMVAGMALDSFSKKEIRQIRERSVRVIFQDPMSALNPVMRINRQFREALPKELRAHKQRAHAVMVDLLEKVQIPEPERVLKQYPHELSGGMRQRVCIAMAVSAKPQLVIADEPTTALDVTTQAAVLDLLQKLMEESGSALLFVSHDLAVVGRICERVAVMYAGVIVESGKTEHVLASPHHPYTQGLLDSIPRMTDRRDEQYRTIEGAVPSPSEHITGCPFAERCGRASEQCRTAMPNETVSGGHMYRCWHPLREAQ